MTTTLAFHLGPLAFDQPVWLLLIPICWAVTIWLGRSSLSGLGTWSRRSALIVRLTVIVLLASVVARPNWRREGEGVNVSVIVDQSDSVRRPIVAPDGRTVDLNGLVSQYLDEAAAQSRAGDTVTRITTARRAYAQSLSTRPRDEPDSQFAGDTDGTNLADAVTLALAVPGKDADGNVAAKRILLVTDGNQTAGDLLTAASSAAAAGVPIDVLPQTYKFEREVLVERIVAPSAARMGQNINLRVVMTALRPTTGRLSLSKNGEPVNIALSGTDTAMSMPVSLTQGTNIITVPVALPLPGPQRFEAVFEPDDPAADAIPQNNRSLAVTFVQSEGRVLVVAPSRDEVQPVLQVLTAARIDAVYTDPSALPAQLVDWGAYDAVVLANTPAQYFTERQQIDLRSYVHDLGGGLVMVGGPEAFGAGGWIGSPLADALPIKLDPPQKRQMPRGALVLVMHSCEMPQGNYWGQRVAQAAVNNLSRLDLAGILEYSFAKGDWWVYPLSPVGNRNAITRAINSLTFGDMKVLDNLIGKAYDALSTSDAGARHMIIISDGDAMLNDRSLLAKCRAARISISTVLVYPHNRNAGGGWDWDQMRTIARETKGNFYPVIDEGEFAKLPSIFIKEAQTVKRSLIWEGEPFAPTVVNAVSEPMRGLASGGFPPLTGYIVGAEREGLSIVTLRGKENDPILAHWQYGLGKSVAFTSDTSVRWTKAWPSWGKFRAFWEQHVRWAMRPSGSADIRVTTEDLGDQTRVIVDALDQQGDRLNFMNFDARVVAPTGDSQRFSLRQVGPGKYEGAFDSAQSGAYVASMRYIVPGAAGESKEGSVQAAVTRPYADEYRTLQDNAALLRLVAERTGGRVVSPDPTRADLWARAGLEMPVSLRPIWIQMAVLALGIFLLDVAVRRVRIDPALIASLLRRGAQKSVSKGSESLGSLKDVRQRAQRGLGTPAQGGAREGARGGAAATDRQTAATKFEVGEAELKKARRLEGAADLSAAPAPIREVRPGDANAAGEQSTTDEAGLSRLRKAKQRAQDKIDDAQQ